MVTNKKRTQTIIQITITYNNILLDEVSEHTSLGLTISNQMSGASHISKLSTKANRKLGILKAIGNKISRRTKEQLYKAFILPNLGDGDIIFGSANYIQKNPFLHTWSIYSPLGETVIGPLVRLAGIKNSKSLCIFKHQLSKKNSTCSINSRTVFSSLQIESGIKCA